MKKSNREKLEELGINTAKVKEYGKTLCPKCSHTRKHKNDPCLSINITDGVYNCWNGCGFAGSVSEKKEPEVSYPRPVFNNNTDLPEKIVHWFFTRAISQKTLTDFRITHGPEYMPQVERERDTIQFNYIRGTELINIKYRDGEKNFKLVKGAELIFYNIDSIRDSKECIITEGEIDTMSFHEAGIKSVVSVPNGADGRSNNSPLIYLDNCWDFFADKKKIYIATDDDEKGRLLQAELARRLGKERCFKISFNGYKDANELLIAEGPEALIKAKENAEEYPIEGIYTIKSIKSELVDILNNGMPEGDKVGDPELDKLIRFMPGELTMCTGIPSHGKSIFLDQIAFKLAKNCGWRFGIFTPEGHPMSIYFARLIKKIYGRKFSKYNINEAQLDFIIDWLENRFNMILPKQEGFNLDAILDKAKILVLKKGIKGLIIDPWNRIEQTIRDNQDSRKFIQQQLTKIINFNQSYGVHTFCVAHPTKMKVEDGIYTLPTLYDISGSADFFNMTQNGMTAYINQKTGKTEVHIQKVKWEHLGRKGVVEYNYDENTTRLLGDGDDPTGSWLDLPPDLEFPINTRVETFNESRNAYHMEILKNEDDDIPF